MSGNLKNRLLVTGASGFLGSEIVRQCEQDQQPVRSLGRRELARPNYHALDLAADPIPDDLFRDIDTVIHSAGLAHQFGKSADDRGRFFAVNADATEKIIRADRKSVV